MKNKFFALLLTLSLCMSCVFYTCESAEASWGVDNLENVRSVIEQAETMTLEELALKAIEESDGKEFRGLGTTSRVKSAMPLFVEYLKQFKPEYHLFVFDWQVPKNNKIFDQILADSMKDVGTISLAVVADALQVETKLVRTGALKAFVPKQWREDGGIFVSNKEWLPFQLPVLRVFMFNNTGEREWHNCWDFVGPGSHCLAVDVDANTLNKNFLYLLTREDYAKILADAFEALSPDQKAYFQPTIDSLAETAKDLELSSDGKYALAWIKLWLESYNTITDDTKICPMLAAKSAHNKSGFCVYSKLREIEETENVSKANISIAAYQEDYKGIGAYGFSGWFFIPRNCPMPWTACAFIAFMSCTVEGFSPWGRDVAGYATTPKIAAEIENIYHHSKAGYVNGENKFDCINDRGYDWWMENGNVVIEDADYCDEVSYTVGSWIETLLR